MGSKLCRARNAYGASTVLSAGLRGACREHIELYEAIVNIRIHRVYLGLASALLLTSSVSLAQEKAASTSPNNSTKPAYDLSREQNLVGTVLSYAAASPTPPLGPRLTLQTPTGVVDVHLGDARTLSANQFTIQPGDTLRIIGEEVNFSTGTQFVARILQKGTQAIAVRNTHGFPIAPSSLHESANSKKQGSAL